MTYHKIETLFVRDSETFKISEPFQFKNSCYGLVNPWTWSEKIHGMNMRATFEPGGVLSAAVTFRGRSDKAQIPGDLKLAMEENITLASFKHAFETFEGSSITLHGEGYGAGINKGGGYSSTKKFIVFDVALVDADGHTWWLSDFDMRDVATSMGLDAVPQMGRMTLSQAAAYVRDGFQSRIAGATIQAEGLVGRPSETLYDKYQKRMIVKLKTADFAPGVSSAIHGGLALV